MGRPRVTISAAVGTTAIRIHAEPKTDVGAVVFTDDGFGVIRNVFSGPVSQAVEIFLIVLDMLEVEFIPRPPDAIGRVDL